MAFHWHLNRKSNRYEVQIAELPFEMHVYEQEGHRNTVVVTCYSNALKQNGNLTYTNSILAGKILAEEIIETGRWVEYAPEYTMKVPPKVEKPVKKQAPPMPKKKKEEPKVTSESINRLLEHFKKG